MFDDRFMKILLFHDTEQERRIERHHRNGGASLGHYGFQYGHPRIPALCREALAERRGGAVEVFLRLPQGRVPVNGPGQFATNIGIGHGLAAWGE